MKKGFTLVELLAVIVILAIVLAIAIPSVTSLIENSRIESYKSQEELVVKATKTYITGEHIDYPINIGDSIEVKLTDLQNKGYLSSINDYFGGTSLCNGYALITKTDINIFEYSPYLKCGSSNTIDSVNSDGLVSSWNFNGNFYDASLYNNHASLYFTNYATNRFNVPNRALAFDGNTSYMVVNNSSSLNFGTNPFTISFWINYTGPTVATQVPATVMYKGISSASNPGFFIGLTTYGGNGSNYGIAASITNGMWGTGNAEHTGAYLPNTWYYVTIVRNSTQLSIYKNGILGYSRITTEIASDISNSYNLQIGTGSWGKLNGRLDDIKFYNRALSASEIKLNYYTESVVNRD